MTGRLIDNPYLGFLARTEQPRVEWPGGAPLALLVKLLIEARGAEPTPGAHGDPRHEAITARFYPRHRAFTEHEYGARIGVFRVLDVLERHGLVASAGVNAEAAERYPFLMHELARRGHEIVAHGSVATRMISAAMSEDEERLEIATTLERIERATGVRPLGWFSQDYGESARTPALLDEAGLRFLADWPSDDQPVLMRTPREIMSLPCQPECDDLEQIWFRRVDEAVWRDGVIETFSGLRAEGARLLCLTLHPWVIGMPHRIGYLDGALASMTRADGFWNATASAIEAVARPQLTRS